MEDIAALYPTTPICPFTAPRFNNSNAKFGCRSHALITVEYITAFGSIL